MSNLSKKIWSYSITNTTLIIDESYGLSEVSIILTSGTGTFKTNATTLNGLVSEEIPLPLGLGIDVVVDTSSILDFVKITTTGTVLILGRISPIFTNN